LLVYFVFLDRTDFAISGAPLPEGLRGSSCRYFSVALVAGGERGAAGRRFALAGESICATGVDAAWLSDCKYYFVSRTDQSGDVAAAALVTILWFFCFTGIAQTSRDCLYKKRNSEKQ
jgi:hypothetical protein